MANVFFKTSTNKTIDDLFIWTKSSGALEPNYDEHTGVPFSLGTVYFTSDGYIVFDTKDNLGNNKRIWMGKNAYSAIYAEDISETHTDIANTYLKRTGGLLEGSGTAATSASEQRSGDTSATTYYYPAVWRFNIAETPKNGDIIVIKAPVAGHDNGVFISIDYDSSHPEQAHYQPVLANGTSRLANQYGAGTSLILIYEANTAVSQVYNVEGSKARVNITGAWRVLNYYDSTNIYQLRTGCARVLGPSTGDSTATKSLYKFEFLIEDKNGLLIPFGFQNDKATTYNKALTTASFNPFSPIFYYFSTTTVNVGSNIAAHSLYGQTIADCRYSFNINSNGTAGSTALTANLPVYIKALYNYSTGTATFVQNISSSNYLERSSLTQNLPTTNPNSNLSSGQEYIYIQLGNAYNKYQIDLNAFNKVVYHWDSINNTCKLFTPVAVTNNTINLTRNTETIIATINNTPIKIKLPASDNTDYKVRQTPINSNDNNNYRILLSNSANDTSEDSVSKKNANLIYNPTENKLSTGNIKLTGELDVTGNVYLRNQTAVDSLTAGSLIVNGNSTFNNDINLAQGAVKWTSNSLPSVASANYFLVIDAFANGGTTKYITKADAIKSLISSSAIGSSTKPVYWTGSAFSAITSYSGAAALTGTPTAPTAAAGTNTTQIATTEFVTNAVAQGFIANDAMVFKGLIGSNQPITQLPTSGYNAGWTYRVANAGIFAGEYCEVGDLLIAIKDGPASGSSVINADWGKVEHNIDGAVFRGSGASNSSVGSSTQPVYVNGSGIVTAITSLEVEAGGTGKDSRRKAGLFYDWTASLKGQKWSRICYIPCTNNLLGSTMILNIRHTRSSVVYNETVMITVHHNSRGNITSLSSSNYNQNSSIQIRALADSSGHCYIELKDSNQGITEGTTISPVYCTLQIITLGDTEPTLKTSFEDGTTLPENYSVAAEVALGRNRIITSGIFSGNLEGNAATATNLSGTKTANYIYAGPSSGNAAAPTFRALVTNDIPNLPGSKITSGTISADRLPKASSSAFGIIKSGTGLSIDNGVASVNLSDLGLSSAMHFIGISSTSISQGGNQNPTIDNNEISVKQNGDVVLWNTQEFVWNGSSWQLLGDENSYKIKQTSVSDPTVASNATAISFISNITQDTNGVITATKKDLQVASTSEPGITQYTADNLNTWLNQLTLGSSDPQDNDYYISQYSNGGTTYTSYHRRPMSKLWNYIRGKADNRYSQTDTKNTAGSTSTNDKIYIIGAKEQSANPQTYSADSTVYISNKSIYANNFIGTAKQSYGLIGITSITNTSGLYFFKGSITNNDPNSTDYTKWSCPNHIANTTAGTNSLILRLLWSDNYFKDIYMSPNSNKILYRQVFKNNRTLIAGEWRYIVQSSTDGVGDANTPIYITNSGNATAITGAIANDTTGNAATATTASKLSNTSAIGSSTQPVYFNSSGQPVAVNKYDQQTGKTTDFVPRVGPDGVMEIGKYIDFHNTSEDTSNYIVRIAARDSSKTDGAGLTLTGTTVGIFKGNLNGTATKATQDGNGNNIINTYLTKTAGVTNITWDNTNKKLIKTINNSNSDIVTLYAANLKLNNTAVYNTELEVKNIKIGNGSTSTSTKNVQLVYDTSLEVLNFVFS